MYHMNDDKLLLYESLIETMTEGVMVFDGDGQVTLCNGKAAELLDVSYPAAGLTLQSFLTDPSGRYDQFADAVFAAIYERTNRHNFTITYSSGAGRRSYLVSTGSLDDSGERQSVLVLINDITELEKLHETFGRYVSDDIARTILETPGGLDMGGTERSVTILMSDLRGFTAMCEKMKPADVVNMLNHYFEAMLDCITAYRGNVIEFLGDGLLVVFGAPVASRTHAADAVAAAISMQKALEEVNVWNLERGYPYLSMWIGINTGRTIVGNIGGENRTKYGVLGSQVNLAGRIESYTVAGQILISESTRSDIDGDILVIEEESDVYPKGVEKPLHLIQIIGIGGDYHLSYNMMRPELIRLDTPYILTYRTLDGKHVSETGYLAKINEISAEQISLITDKKHNIFDNIRLDLAGYTYGKVVKKTADGYLVDITARPEGYDMWLAAMTGSR